MGPSTTSSDQRDPEAVPTRRQWPRWIAPLLLLASLLLTVLSENWGHLFSAFLVLALVYLVLSIVCGILARQWILISVVVATIAGVLGLGAILMLGRRGQDPEPAAVANLRTINTAEVTYLSSSSGSYGTIADLIAAGLLDETFTGTKAGYAYAVATSGKDYTAEATPISVNTGRFGYYSHPDAVIRYSTTTSLAPGGQAGHSIYE